jgi:outer membrane protein TolC
MRRTKAADSILLAVVLLISRTGSSAELQNVRRLTLREAVQLALQQNPQAQISKLNIAISQQEHAIAKAALLPQVGVQAFDRDVRFDLDSFVGVPLPGSAHHAGPFQVLQAGPVVTMPIFDLTLWRRWQASHQALRAAEAQNRTVREQTVALVVSQYLLALRAAAERDAAQSQVDLAQTLYSQAKHLEEAGVGTGLDTLRANVELQNESQRLLVAETKLKTAQYGLARLLDLNPFKALELTDTLSFSQTPDFPVEQALQQALASRPEMETLGFSREGAILEKRAASDSRFPTLNFGGGWGYQGRSLPTAIPAHQYQLTLDLPLFTGGRVRAENAKSELEVKRLSEQIREQKDQIAFEVNSALAQVESARHQVDVANLGVELAHKEVAQARERFEEGVANNVETVTAQNALARATDNRIDALYGYNQSRADLARATGQIETMYAK